ncbi:MiaB/RimO family radical SAM methylthiotransferase, partial [Patescibacteria group bacterium]|nr:MiaB/RimO family radical SAM methylthiotransferase [Patescibacteria group bacterium]
ITFGCQMNVSDSERIAGMLEKIGYKSASKINEADLIVVNMCSVRQSAVDRVYGFLQKIKIHPVKSSQSEVFANGEQFNRVKTILTGCILKEDKKKFSNRFDLILDIKDLAKFPNLLASKNYKLKTKSYFKIKPKYSIKDLSYIPIMTGCNNFCSYCVVPYTRGKEISRPVEEILKEARTLIKKGCKEIVLLGQNVNSYQVKRKAKSEKRKTTTQSSKLINFSELLKMIDAISGNFQISFLTSHPKDFSDELIEVIAASKKIKKEIHLPAQSGDNEILKKMNRGYTREDYAALIKKIREKIFGVKISSDIIVGFPGETKKQFAKTLDLVKKARFSKIYTAKYSPRTGTAAFKLKDNVPAEEKEKRRKAVLSFAREI